MLQPRQQLQLSNCCCPGSSSQSQGCVAGAGMVGGAAVVDAVDDASRHPRRLRAIYVAAPLLINPSYFSPYVNMVELATRIP